MLGIDLKLDIHLFMTTHDESLPKLNSFEHTEEVKQWFSQVDDVAVHRNRFIRIDDEMLAEANKHHVQNAHAIIFYPPGRTLDAHNVGGELKNLFHRHKKKFDWHIAPNKNLFDKYEIYVEIIVKTKTEDEKEGETAGEQKPAEQKPAPAKRETIHERNARILAELHQETMKPPQ